MAQGKKEAGEKNVEKKRGLAKEQQGIVVSDKMDKTIVVSVVTRVKHPVYGKFIRQTTKYYAHDEKGESAVGDLVKISQTRPLSATKRWRLREVVRKAD
jgi:small subunit ribosomal protein S17